MVDLGVLFVDNAVVLGVDVVDDGCIVFVELVFGVVVEIGVLGVGDDFGSTFVFAIVEEVGFVVGSFKDGASFTLPSLIFFAVDPIACIPGHAMFLNKIIGIIVSYVSPA